MAWINEPAWSTIDVVQEPHPILEALREYLAKLQAEQRASFSSMIAASDSADVRELERMFALEDERSQD